MLRHGSHLIFRREYELSQKTLNDGALPLTEKLGGNEKMAKRTGIKLEKISEGSEKIPKAIRKGYMDYIINIGEAGGSASTENDGYRIRRLATGNNVNVNIFTSLDTVKTLLDVLEETTLCISTIDS